MNPDASPKTPFLCVLDEMGHYLSPGFAHLCSSLAPLGPWRERLEAQEQAEELAQHLAPDHPPKGARRL